MLKNLVKKANQITTRFGANALLLQSRCKEKLSGTDGNEIVTIIVVIVIILVVAVVVFFPQLVELVNGAFDNADSKIDEVWNYKG